MKRNCPSLLTKTAPLSIYLLCFVGCDAVNSIFPRIPPSPFDIVGEDGNKLFFTETKPVGDVPADQLGFDSTWTANLYTLDLETLESELLMSGLSAGPFGPRLVMNGRWIAWVDLETDTIQLIDRETGIQRTLFEGSEVQLTSLLEVRLDRLVAFRSVDRTPIPVDRTYEYIIFELPTGDLTRIGDTWLYVSYAIEGDHFALFNNQRTSIRALSAEQSGNLDVVNLATGERRTVAPNIRVDSGGGSLYIRGDELLWQEFRQGKFRTKVRSYDFDTERLSTLVNPFEREDTTAFLVGVQGETALVVIDSGPILANFRTLEIGPLAGDRTQIVGVFQTLLDVQALFGGERLVGDFVVWTDELSFAFWTYDTRTRSTRRFDPTKVGGAE